MTAPVLLTFTQLVQNQAAAIQASAKALANFTTGSMLRAIVEATSAVGLFFQSQVMQVLGQTRAATSQGSDLDSWMADYSFARLAATSSTGQVSFSRFSTAQQAVVPVGAQVQTSDGTQQFSVLLDTTNSAYSAALGGYVIAAGVTSVNVAVQAVNTGSVTNVVAGAISQIIQSIQAVDTVTNAAGFTNALDAESDPAFRARFVNYIGSLSKATKQAIAQAITSVQQGLAFTLVENQTYAGAASPAYFYVVVDDGSGNPSAGLLASVGLAIDAVRAEGTTFNVFGPVVVTANWSMTIAVAAGNTKATYQAIVLAAVTNYINTLPLGMTLPYTKLAQIAYEAAPGIVTDVTIVLLNGGTSDLTATPKQVVKSGTGAVN